MPITIRKEIAYVTGLTTVYGIIYQESTGYAMNIDNTFTLASPANPYIPATEDVLRKGVYYISTSYPNDKYSITWYRQIGGSPDTAVDTLIGESEDFKAWSWTAPPVSYSTGAGMVVTAQDIIKASMRKLGIIAKSEVPTNDEMQDALQALNGMIGEWGIEKLMSTATTRESFPLVANQQRYTIGLANTSDFVTSKPSDIIFAFYRDGAGIDKPLDIITREEFQSFQDKSIVQAPPLSLFYDPGVTQQANQAGTINLYYTPDASTPYTLFIDSIKPFVGFSSLTSLVTFPTSYFKALVYNLALEIAPEYPGTEVPRVVEMLATESKENVESMNAPRILAGLDLPKGKGGSFNWISGDPN